MNQSIRGSDVYVKADLSAMLLGLQYVAAQYPPGEFAAGFLACLSAVRATLAIPATLEEIDAVTPPPAAMLAANGSAGSVRVLPPAPAPAPALRSGVAADGRRFAVRALEVEDWDGQIVSVDDAPPAQLPAGRPAELPPPRRLQPAPVVVADADRVVEVERGSDPVVVRPDLWRLVASDPAFVYDEIAGPGRYVLPADRWVPVPVAWRHRVGVELVPDQWALFVTVDWAIRHLGRERVRVLPGGRAQITG